MQVSAATIDSARAVVAAHSSWATWALIGVVGLEALTIVLLIKHKGGFEFIADFPTTNFRILVGIALFSYYNVSLGVAGYVSNAWPPVDIVLAIEGALLINLGLDVTQYGVKRHTEDPEVIAANAAANCPPVPAAPPAPPLEPASDVPPPNFDPAPLPLPPPPPAPAAARVAPPARAAKTAMPAHKFEPGN